MKQVIMWDPEIPTDVYDKVSKYSPGQTFATEAEAHHVRTMYIRTVISSEFYEKSERLILLLAYKLADHPDPVSEVRKIVQEAFMLAAKGEL